MIEISEAPIDVRVLLERWDLNNLQKDTLRKMAASSRVYPYESFQQLRFELKMRKHMVRSAIGLNDSGAVFATFKESRCNPEYWILTEEGGFRLKEGVSPSIALKDIYESGDKYAFECATAIIIVCYKAVLASLGESIFNRLFDHLYLWDGYHDKDLALTSQEKADGLAGDIRYIKNPDVDPKNMEWQGENAVDLGNGLFFGHGIGITTVYAIIMALNTKRKPDATRSAYLMDEAIYPRFKYLAAYDSERLDMEPMRDLEPVWTKWMIANIGNTTYIMG